MLFHAVVGEDAREGNSPSWFNVLEAKLVMEYVLKLKAKRGGQAVTDDDIGEATSNETWFHYLGTKIQGS